MRLKVRPALSSRQITPSNISSLDSSESCHETDESRDSHEKFWALMTSQCLGIDFTPALAKLVLETPMTVAHRLSIWEGSCAELPPTQFHALVLHCLPYTLYLGCRLRASQISDEFLGALLKNRVVDVSFPESGPVDGDSFSCSMDDMIVDFCVQSDVPAGQGVNEREPSTALTVRNGSFAKDLFKRLVEVSVGRRLDGHAMSGSTSSSC